MPKKHKKITVIGNAVIDILTRPVSPLVFEKGSHPVEQIKLSYGGDALNEAVLLARFGRQTELRSRLGQDEAGQHILEYLRRNRVDTTYMISEAGADTSISLVLIDEKSERYFLSDPAGSQRKLSAGDLLPQLDTAADLVSFASIFVSSAMGIEEMTRIFRQLKSKPGRILAADITKAKHGETLADLRPLLPYVDYIFPNAEEAALLTGQSAPCRNAELLVDAGAKCAVVKCGKAGCVIHTAAQTLHIPAYPVKSCVDTTGAGDSFAAGFLWALSESYPLEDCGKFACATASCAVECTGATEGILSLEEPLRRFRRM